MIHQMNYRLTREFLSVLAENPDLQPVTVERYRLDLVPLLEWADETPLGQAPTIRPGFSRYLATRPTKNGSGQLSLSSQRQMVNIAHRFFEWAALEHPRQFHLVTTKYLRSLRIRRFYQGPGTLQHVDLDTAIRLATVPVAPENLLLRRAQASAAALFLTGATAGSFSSAPIKAFDLSGFRFMQWPSLGVQTNNRRKITTQMLRIPELMEVVTTWDACVRSQLPETAPWFAPVDNRWGVQTLCAGQSGANRNTALNDGLRRLANIAGLPYYSASEFRHGTMIYAVQRCRSLDELRAVAANFGIAFNSLFCRQDFRWTRDEIETLLASWFAKSGDADNGELPIGVPA